MVAVRMTGMGICREMLSRWFMSLKGLTVRKFVICFGDNTTVYG